jgi:hypothetical protein
MVRMVLYYSGDNQPTDHDIKKIQNLGVNIISQRNPRLIELEIPDSSVGGQDLQDLEAQLPEWKLSPVIYYGIPELGLPQRPTQPKQIESLNPEFSSEILGNIREYLQSRNNQANLASLVSALTNKTVKWQHILESIKNSDDIHQDGKKVWLEQ